MRLAQDRFTVGAGTQLEVRDASLKLTQSRLALLNARIDQSVARADLDRAVGRRLDTWAAMTPAGAAPCPAVAGDREDK